jgi:hypothetical protein
MEYSKSMCDNFKSALKRLSVRERSGIVVRVMRKMCTVCTVGAVEGSILTQVKWDFSIVRMNVRYSVDCCISFVLISAITSNSNSTLG